MARFLRDIRVSNIQITESTIKQISENFTTRAKALRNIYANEKQVNLEMFLTFILRFDDKGHRFFSLDELLIEFQRAKVIERLIITVETGESLATNRGVGEHLELRLDKHDPNNCYLSVSSDNSDWVDASFSSTQEILLKCKTRNGIARSVLSTLSIQLLGVIVGFGLSIWVAERVSQNLNIQNSFVISFLFSLLIFSNAWFYINGVVLRYINGIFPNIEFQRDGKDRFDWFMQAIIGGIAATFTAFLLAESLTYVGKFFVSLTK